MNGVDVISFEKSEKVSPLFSEENIWLPLTVKSKFVAGVKRGGESNEEEKKKEKRSQLITYNASARKGRE